MSEAMVADLRLRLKEAEAALARNAGKVKEAERWVATEAERAHNAEQPIVLLPDALRMVGGEATLAGVAVNAWRRTSVGVPLTVRSCN